MQNKGLLIIIVFGLLGLLANSTLYVVKETERAVLLEFGEVVNPDVETGLHFKWPLVNNVRKFDGRILTLDQPAERYLTIEKKPLDVDFYAKWRVVNTAKYYTATNGEEIRAQGLLNERINAGLRNQFGGRTVHEVVSGERDQLMTELTKRLDAITQTEFGIELVDIRVKKVDLPERVSESVFNRMKSEREREAREHRYTGREKAEFIRAAADRERTVLLADAYREAEQIRGDGDAEAAGIYADAYNRDPEFYAFVRSLNAYKESFGSKDDLLVVDSDSEFFQYLNSKK